MLAPPNARGWWKRLMLRRCQRRCWALSVLFSTVAVSALAQANLDAGKSAAQIFSDTCKACHRSPREIKRTSAAFLREHYTTGTREATAMAAYLASVGTDSLAVQERRPPAMGAGRIVPTAGASPQAPNQSKPESKPESKSGSKSDLEAASPILPPDSRATANGSAQPDQGNSAAPRGVSRRPSPDVELHAGSSSAAAANGAGPHAILPGGRPPAGDIEE